MELAWNFVGTFTIDCQGVMRYFGTCVELARNEGCFSLEVRVYSSDLQLQGQVYSAPNGISQFSFPLTAGQYFLEIYGVPTSTSYLYPYNFTLSVTLSNPNFTSADSLKIYPNPTSSLVFFDNSIEKFETANVINYLGQVVSETRFSAFEANQEVDLSSFTAGVYLVKFANNDKSITQKIIKE